MSGLPVLEVCWADRVGDRWEEEGVDPRLILESGEILGHDCLQGIMMISKITHPRLPSDLSRAIVQHRDSLGRITEVELITERGYNPLFVASWPRIYPTIC